MSQQTALGDLLVRLLLDADQYDKQLQKALKKIEDASARIERIGSSFSKYLTAPIAAFGVLSLKTFANFEDAMTHSLSRMGGLTGELEQGLKKAALKTNDPIAAAKAYETFANAGFNAKQSMDALGGSYNFAKANTLSLESATALLTRTQNVLGLRTKDSGQNTKNLVGISDMLTKASLISGSSVEELGEALEGRGGAAIRRYGLSLKEGIALLATLGNQGIRGARAGALLERMLEGRGAGSQEAIQNLQSLREQTLAYENALSTAGGTTTTIATQRGREYSEQLKDLYASLQRVEYEVGTVLAPYLEVLNQKIQAGFKWWESLSESTKTWIIAGAAAAAAIGPIIYGIGLIVGMAGTLFAFLTSSAAAIVGFFALNTALAASFAFVGESVLEMTGLSNDHINDMVQNVRIGGTKISTWLTAAWLQGFDAWEFVSNRIAENLKSLLLYFRDGLAQLHRWFMTAGESIAAGWLKVKYALHIIDDKELIQQTNDLHKAYEESQENSLQLQEGRYREFLANIEAMNKESGDKRAAYAAAIDQIFADDLAAKAEEQKAKIAGASHKPGEAPKVPGVDIPDFSNVHESTHESDFTGSLKQASKDALVTNFNRFSLAGLAGFSNPAPKTQEVKSKGIESKLDLINNTLQGKGGIAVLGD